MMLTAQQHRQAMMALSIAHLTDPATNRMRTRTAKEQHAAAMAELSREQDQTRNDDEDDSSLRNNVLR